MSVSRRRTDREPLNQLAATPATAAPATGSVPSPVERLSSGPTHDEIARRAYQLFEERGRESGREWDDYSLSGIAFAARRTRARMLPFRRFDAPTTPIDTKKRNNHVIQQ